MKKYFIHNPVFRLLAPAIYGVLTYLLILLINNNVTEVEAIFNGQEVYVFIGLSYLALESCRLVIVLLSAPLNRRFPGLRSTILLIVITSLVSVALTLIAINSYFEYMIGFSIGKNQLWTFTTVFTVTAILYNVLYLSNYYLNKENTLRLNAEKQQRQVLELEMMEFKNDINPDLLYESLESLIALMYRDVEKAEDYIDCLASTYRYVLTNRQLELVTVGEEIVAARNIVKLLNERYHGMIRFETSVDDREQNMRLIPGSIPLVLESIVRNTIISRFEPFVIQCYVEDDYITLQSRLNDKLMLHEASDHAVTRLQKSYSLYSDQPLIRVKAYQENYIKLPVITLAEEPV